MKGMDFRKQKASVDRLHLHRAGLGALLGLAGLQIPESCEAVRGMKSNESS